MYRCEECYSTELDTAGNCTVCGHSNELRFATSTYPVSTQTIRTFGSKLIDGLIDEHFWRFAEERASLQMRKWANAEYSWDDNQKMFLGRLNLSKKPVLYKQEEKNDTKNGNT